MDEEFGHIGLSNIGRGWELVYQQILSKIVGSNVALNLVIGESLA